MSGNQQPQGQQNPLSSFGFKPTEATAATSSTPSGGFGGLGTSPSLFGGGQNNATNTPVAPKFGGGSLDSAQNSNQGAQQPAPATSSIFSSPSGAQTSSLFSGAQNFGKSTATNLTTPNPLFGGNATQSTTQNATSGGVSAASAGNLFGSVPGNQPGTTLGNGGASSTAPAGTNIFGNLPSGAALGNSGAPPTTTPQPALNIFGASKNAQAASAQTAGNTGSTSANAPTSLFGNAPSSTPATTQAPSSSFGNFGAQPVNNSSQPGTSAAPTLFTSINSTPKPATPLPSGAATQSTAPTPGTPSLFANLPKKPESAPFSGSTAPTFSALAAAKSTSDGGEKDPRAGAPDVSKDSKEAAPNKDGVPASSPFAGFTLGGNKDASASKPATSATASAAGPSTAAPTVTSVPAPSMLRGKTVEDIVNRWATELEKHTREFSQFASEVAVWDRTLIENGNYISALYATVLAAESTQASLDQSLTHVEQQQRHLAATLDQYEKSATEILHGPGGIMTFTEGLGLADSERDKSYTLAANLYTQLDDLSRSLTQMVEAVNGLNLSPQDESQDDTISTVVGILNAHLSSLQWIDGALNEMDGKIKDTERKIKDSGARGGSQTESTSRRHGYGLGP